MEGDLREFSLPEILQFVSLGSRSGVLEILRRDGIFRVCFSSGIITGLNADGWTLAQALRDDQLLPAEVGSSLLRSNTTTPDLRNALLTGGHLTAEEWTAFVARQVERLLFTLFDVTEGKFRFRQGTTHPGPWLPVRVTTDRAVLEGTRWSETWQRASRAFHDRKATFRRTGRAPGEPVSVSHVQWRVYVALMADGRISDLARRAVLNEADVVEGLLALIDAGLAEASAPGTGRATGRHRPEPFVQGSGGADQSGLEWLRAIRPVGDPDHRATSRDDGRSIVATVPASRSPVTPGAPLSD